MPGKAHEGRLSRHQGCSSIGSKLCLPLTHYVTETGCLFCPSTPPVKWDFVLLCRKRSELLPAHGKDFLLFASGAQGSPPTYTHSQEKRVLLPSRDLELLLPGQALRQGHSSTKGTRCTQEKGY